MSVMQWFLRRRDDRLTADEPVTRTTRCEDIMLLKGAKGVLRLKGVAWMSRRPLSQAFYTQRDSMRPECDYSRRTTGADMCVGQQGH